MKLIFNIKQLGFTLIEVLVSVTVFVLVITATIGIFISSLQGKERVNQLKEIEDNARYTMDLMAREIRMGSIPISESGNNDSNLTFTDSGNITYNLIGNSLTKNNIPITSSKIKIANLKFYVNNFSGNNLQPRVTVFMTVTSLDNSVSMDFQTTVSSRTY